MPNIKIAKKRSMAFKITKDVKELIKARLNVLPANINISIGSEGAFSRDELIKRVDCEDKIGRKMIQVDMEFLQSLKKGGIYPAPFKQSR